MAHKHDRVVSRDCRSLAPLLLKCIGIAEKEVFCIRKRKGLARSQVRVLIKNKKDKKSALSNKIE
jgi:hypothetical protein